MTTKWDRNGAETLPDRPPKPPGSTWTDEQWEAIRLRGSDILVAAAAGSGKTAVLVERIIRRISDERDPVDVDRLLVATFTNAAAGEMRERIRDALEKRLIEQPESDHLRKQIALIHRASITTLHSFCLDVIRRHHQRIRLDPAFRIANVIETELMRQDILSDLLEEQYDRSGEDSPFWQLADAYGGERGDDALFRLVGRLYDYSRSHPWPDHWLLGTASAFEQASLASSPAGSHGENETDRWKRVLMADVRLELQGTASLLEEALRLCERPGGPVPYGDNLKDDLAQVHLAASAADRSWNELYDAFAQTVFGKLNACRGSEVDKSLQERVKQLRDRAKKQINDMKEELFERTPEQYAAEMAETAPLVLKLAEIVTEFGERYRQAKLAKGLVDFSDLEHYCLDILRHPDSQPGTLIPSDAAEQYREQFVEILLDEYQDTNTVQEAIVALIARPAPGNRFMVGDVKQSIYRFRLAEPGLFMDKYRRFEPAEEERPTGGRKIDLARNFRSRQEIVDGVNFVFKQIMTEPVGEMEYDDAAKLVCGASYPEIASDHAIQLALIDRGGAGGEDESSAGDDETEDANGAADAAAGLPGVNLEQEEQQAETAQLEARYIASQIRQLIGMDGHAPYQVYDRSAGGVRPVAFRDIVILLRATSGWAPVFMEELRTAGIPGYADLNTGYFTATEVEAMYSLLQVIDNPYQDIPIAAVLRCPMFGLSSEELAVVRIRGTRKPFYEAVIACLEQNEEEAAGAGGGVTVSPELRSKLTRFREQLEGWRDEAKMGSLSELIWHIYRQTGYYDYVGGMPGGLQRQANLRALYDRARQYESTSFRGLFRFLRFVERMRESGADLGAARALGEQEDVVRIMSIHKSKGLEFPVVFVAGLGKTFNQTDLNDSFLLHKELGFGPVYVDSRLRVACPSLPMLAIRRRMKMEMLAEELRVLYVALTRPKEKLVLVGTVKSFEKSVLKWGRMLEESGWHLPAHELARSRNYLDWLGPSLVRHPQAQLLRAGDEADQPYRTPPLMADEQSQWKAGVVPSAGYAQAAATVEVRFADDRMEAVAQLKPVDSGNAERQAELGRRFDWTYPHEEASGLFSKTTVSELKRLGERLFRGEESPGLEWPDMGAGKPRTDRKAEESGEKGRGRAQMFDLARRPSFLGKRGMTAAERGSIYHAVMQHISLQGEVTEEVVRSTLDRMVAKQLIQAEHRDEVSAAMIASFFREPIGRRLLAAKRVHREVPFSFALPADEVIFDASAGEAVQGESVLVQGIIDCLFEENGELVLLDYKTDAIYGDRLAELTKRYGIQLSIYARAIEQIWRRPVKEKVLFFFDGNHITSV